MPVTVRWALVAIVSIVSAGTLQRVFATGQADAEPSKAPDRPQPHNVILFIADGLRNGSVNSTDAPTLLSVRRRGVNFANSHSLYPTLTTPNAASIATGHYLGDTGDFSNAVYIGFPIFNQGNFGKSAGTPAPFLESDPVLGDLDGHFPNGNFLNETTLLALARAHGFNTAAIGKLGPVAIQDVAQLRPDGGQFATPQTVILDDSTGSSDGVPLSADASAWLTSAGLSLTPAPRNQPSGSATTAGALAANVAQQQWFADAATKAVLPAFVKSGRPFVLVYWSRDPDGTQHNQGDSLNKLKPGINGPTSRAGVANADSNLKQLLDFVQGDATLRDTTDVFVTSDHGFATISKHETDPHGAAARSYSTGFEYLTADGKVDVIRGWLPPGFLALDLAHDLDLPLYDADCQVSIDGIPHYCPVDPTRSTSSASRQHPAGGNALIGGSGRVQDKTDARVIVAANGGTDLIYVPDHDQDRARTIVDFLTRQDYVGGLFVENKLGRMPGTLALSAIGLEGTALLPRPSIVVSFRTFLLHPDDLLSTVQIADTPLQEGQGMHGSLDRSNTFNNMAAIGPDFKQGFVSRSPVSNADIVPTLAHALGLELPATGKLRGRVIVEALAGGPAAVASRHEVLRSLTSPAGKATVLQIQVAEGRRYFDAACYIGGARKRGRSRSRAPAAPTLCYQEQGLL